MLCGTSLSQNFKYYIMPFLTFLKMKRSQAYREIIVSHWTVWGGRKQRIMVSVYSFFRVIQPL